MSDVTPVEPGEVVGLDTPEDGAPEKPKRGPMWFVEWAVVIVVALVAALVLRDYGFQTFFIPSGSMEPTLQVGDRIIVSKLSVEFGTINRGDVVVFKRPAAENCGGSEVADLVKRVIGLPGEGLKSVGNTIYYTDDPKSATPTWVKVNQTWQHVEPLAPPPIPTGTIVPKDSYYMIGDNQPQSCDSRYWGTVPRSSIVGKAVWIIWPLSRFGSI